MKKLISALPPLVPTSIYNARTGEAVTLAEFTIKATGLVTFVQDETTRLYETNGDKLCAEIEQSPRLGSANSFARQRGYKSNTEKLPSKVKAKSRINELVLHKLVSETASYVRNPNPRKQPPTFSPKINLGAVDKQMVTLSVVESTLTLVWKCWDYEYLLEFTIPGYVLHRRIAKWSLPTVELRNGIPVFIYSIQETPETRVRSSQVAGIDLGRVEPYIIAVVNQNSKRAAHYTANGRLKQVNNKRERLLVEKNFIQTKINQYTALGLDTTVLVTERNRKRGKITALGAAVAQQLGAEVTKKLAKHSLNILNVEDLRWVQGTKYGSRWNHSRQQEALTHALARKGITTRRVNPKNTSQECHKCATPLVYNPKTRTVWCGECKSRFDRDFNAAMNIACRKKSYPVVDRTSGGNYSSITEQVTEVTPHSSVLGLLIKATFLT